MPFVYVWNIVDGGGEAHGVSIQGSQQHQVA
jgi:hypothetical protein